MRDPARLLEEGATDAELRLLRAGAAEEPSNAARQKLAAALGLGVLGPPSTPPPFGAGSVAHTVKVGASKLGVKWLLLAGGGALAGGSALLYVASHRAAPHGIDPAPTHVALASVAPSATAPSANALPAEAPAPATEAGDVAPAEEAATEHVRAGSKSIAREIEELDAARALLAAGAPQKALEALRRYGRENRSGMLRQEADLLRIEALVKLGDPASARRAADRFLATYPGTPHRQQVRALVGEDP